MSSASEFGKDHGLIHEVVVTGRKAMWDAKIWAKLAHSEKRMREVREYLLDNASIVPNRPAAEKKQPKLLVPDGNYSAVEIAERHDPAAFYQTRSGLYVYDDFHTRIVAAAKPTDAGTKWQKLPRFKLGRNGTGDEMKTARPRSVWSATEFCPWLAAKLSKQAEGKDGEFLNNDWANLFLVEGAGGVFVVYVYCGVGEWRVDAWLLGSEWDVGDQFGSRS